MAEIWEVLARETEAAGKRVKDMAVIHFPPTSLGALSSNLMHPVDTRRFAGSATGA